MPRRASPGVRPIEADPMYGSKLVQQVINKVMVDGKKSTAERIVYDALDILSRRTSQDPVPALEESVKQLTPVLEVRSRRVGGATYQVPVEVPQQRARTLAVRWLIEFSRGRREKTMSERLAGELADAQSQQGGAFKRKDDIFRMAQANKALPTTAGAHRLAASSVARVPSTRRSLRRSLVASSQATRASASRSGPASIGECPPGSSMGSTPSRCRAAARDHWGRIIRSSRITMQLVGTSGKRSRGHRCSCGVRACGRSRAAAVRATAGSQSW